MNFKFQKGDSYESPRPLTIVNFHYNNYVMNSKDIMY